MVDHGSPIRTRHHEHVIFVGSNMVAVVAARLALLLISELIGGILQLPRCEISLAPAHF